MLHACFVVEVERNGNLKNLLERGIGEISTDDLAGGAFVLVWLDGLLVCVEVIAGVLLAQVFEQSKLYGPGSKEEDYHVIYELANVWDDVDKGNCVVVCFIFIATRTGNRRENL